MHRNRFHTYYPLIVLVLLILFFNFSCAYFNTLYNARKLYKEAENKIRLYFILDAIATEEKIEISPQEVEDWIKTLAVSYNRQFDEVKKYYEEHNLIGGVMEELREEKTLDFVLDEADKVESKSKK